MSLLSKFRELVPPNITNPKLINALTLEEYPFAKIGMNSEGFPIILISSSIDGTHLSKVNVRLKYIELTHNQECRVTENRNARLDNFSTIIFKSSLKTLQFYFLGIVETLLEAISKRPTQQEVFKAFKNFIEIFRSLSDPPLKTLQGLWAELFLIERSKEPETLLNYWHYTPTEKFDFNADTERIEVKSSSNLDRIHIFSAEQLDPPEGKQIIIASIFTKQVSNGKSIANLIESIQGRITDSLLAEKLFSIVSKTLGHTIEQSLKINFDYNLAGNSLRFYKHQDINKIEKTHIPSRVSEVHFKSDLTELKYVTISDISNKGTLYKAI